MIVRSSISIANNEDAGTVEVTADGVTRSYTGSENIVASQYEGRYGIVPNTVIMRSLLDSTIEYKFSIDVLTTINGQARPNNLADVLTALNGVYQGSPGFPGNGTGGGGGGQEIFLSPLHFKGGTSVDNPLIPRGFQGTDNLDYSASGGELEELLPQAPAPTNPINDDDEDTMSFTKVLGFPTYSSYEYTLNGGSSVSNLPSNSLVPVGNSNKAIGQVGVRVKETVSNNSSDWLFNTVAFNYAAPVETVLSSWHGNIDGTFHNTGNTLTPSGVYGQAIAGHKILAGTEGYVKWAVPTNDYGGVMLDPVDDTEGIGGATLSAWMSTNQMIARYFGNYFGSGGGTIPPGPDSYLRLRADLSNVYAEYSVDGGVSWVQVPDAFNTRPNADLYIKTMWEVLFDAPQINQIQGIVGFNVVPV